MINVRAQPLTVGPESVVPLPDKFNLEKPASDVPPEIARFQALIQTYHEAFTRADVTTRFVLFDGIPGAGHLLRLYPDRWQPVGDEFLRSIKSQQP
jgi:hypothetical protein